MATKISYIKEKMKQALTSTKRVISDDFGINNKKKTNTNHDHTEVLKVDSLSGPEDFIRLRAEFDSSALEKKIFKQRNI